MRVVAGEEGFAQARQVRRLQHGALQRGRAVTVGDRRIESSEVVEPPRPGRRVAISGDTRPVDADGIWLP